MAVASYNATRTAAAEGPANSSVPKLQRVGARRAAAQDLDAASQELRHGSSGRHAGI